MRSKKSHSLALIIFSVSILLGGCASPIIFSQSALTVQLSKPDTIIVHKDAKSYSSSIIPSSKFSKPTVFAPEDNTQNIVLIRHGDSNEQYEFIAWPDFVSQPCTYNNTVAGSNSATNVEWINSVSFSTVTKWKKNVTNVVAFDNTLPGWVQIAPNASVLHICPTNSPIAENEYEAGKLYVYVSANGQSLIVSYNNNLYSIDLLTPMTRASQTRFSISDKGKIASLAVIDGPRGGKVRLFAWSKNSSDPTQATIEITEGEDSILKWLSNRMITISSKSGQLIAMRYNLNRSWEKLTTIDISAN